MSDENTTVQTQAQDPAQRAEDLNNKISQLTVGYVVGVTETGDFVFEVLGDKPGLVQLMGVHQYANTRVQMLSDMNLGYGTPLLAGMLDNLQKMVKVLLNMSTQNAQNELNRIIKP
jgi:hypothetical protein